MVKVCGAEVSTPPLAVPPSSCAVTVTVAVPFASAATVNVSTPVEEIDGCALKRLLLLLLVLNETVCDDSFAGPALIAVAHAAEYAPESSFTVTLPPLVNDGASFTLFTVIVNVCDGDVSSPPLAVPPLSIR